MEIQKPMRKSTFEKSLVSTKVLGKGFASESNTVTTFGGKAMGEKKISKLGFILMALAAVFVTLGCNSKEEFFQATFINGTGKTIKSISLSNGNSTDSYEFTIDLQDKGVCAINLPLELKHCGLISAGIEYENGKSAAMKKHETISLSDDSLENVFLLSLKGKKSTVPVVSGAAAGGVTVATIAGAAASAVATWGASGLTYYLALAGSIVGGGIVAGTVVVAAAPIIVATATTGTVYTIRHFFMDDTLIVHKLSKDQQVILPQDN